MGKGLRAGWVIATWVLFLAGYAYGQQGSDSGVWHGGTGSWSNAGQWDCLGPDFINAVSPVCASPPNGTKFAIDLTNGGTINVDMNVSVDAVTALTNATLVLNGTSLSVAPGGLVATLASAQLSNGAVINPGLGLVTSNLTMQNSTINGAVSAAGFATPTGTIDISGSTIQKLVFSGSGTLKNSTLGDNSVLEISGPSSVSNTSFNGFVGVDSGGSLTIDNGSKINSILFGAPQDVPVGASVSGSFTLQGGSQLTISGAKLLLGAVLGSSGTMKLNDTSSLSADNELVGDGGDGTFNQSGGTNTISGTLTVGNQFFSNSSYNLGRTGSAGTLTAGNEIIGNAGTGFFGQGFGTQTLNSITGTLTLGAQAGGSGTYALDFAGNNVTSGDEVVGDAGTGVFSQGNGSDNNISGTLTLGRSIGGSGTYILAASGGTVEANTEIVGDGDKGTFNQYGGTNTISGTLTVGNQFFSNSSYTLGRIGSTGTLTAGNEIIGNAGTGFFGQGFGTQTLNSITGTLTLGAQAGGSGTYVLDQAGNNVAAGDEVVGDAGTGLFSQGDGSDNNVSGTLTLGRSSGGSGTYTLSASGGTVEANTEIVGDGGQGTFNQSGGTNTISGTLTVGNQSQSNSSYTLGRIGSAGTLTAANEVVGDAGTGVFFQGNGSANNISGTLTLGNSIGGSGTYNFSGGSLFATNLLVGNFGTGTFTQTGGTATIPSLTISANSGSGTYDLQAGGTLNASSIQVNSQGTLKLDGGSISYINLELAGGTLSGLVPIVNATSLTGWGVIDAPLFTNNGSATFQGGPTTINGPTINGGIMTVSSQTTFQGNFLNLGEFTNLSVATFGGPVTNAGVFRNFGAANGIPSGVTFVGPFTNNGAYMGDPSMNRFQDLIVNSTGYLTGTAGDVFFIAGNFQNLSTQNTLWDTSPAELEFGGTGTHTFDLAGVNGAGFANNFAWGTLVIDAGNILALGTGSGDALYVNFLQGLDISGNLITNIDGAAGLFIYYNPADNPFLQGNYNLEGGGELIAANGPAPTPEPGTLLLIASGLGSFVARRRWHTNKNASSSH